jgi:hypothetical protein
MSQVESDVQVGSDAVVGVAVVGVAVVGVAVVGVAVVGVAVVGVAVVAGVTEDSDGNAVSVVAPPHAARRPPATMILTNLFITTGLHNKSEVFVWWLPGGTEAN